MLLQPHSDAYPDHGSIAVIDADPLRRTKVCLQCASRSLHLLASDSFPELMADWDDVRLILVHDEGDQVAQAVRLGLESGRSLPVIAYAQDPTINQVVEAMKAGASDYLAHPFQEASVRRIVDQAHRTEALSPAPQTRQNLAKCSIERLSQREKQVLEALSKGLTSQQIAHDLAISPRTVETHRYNLRRKLGSIRTAQAIRLAVELGLEGGDWVAGQLARREQPASPA